jgi:GTP pyrophosphokinase
VGIQTTDDFYNTLGFGGLSLQRFIPKMKEELEKICAPEEPPMTQEDVLSKVKLTDINKKKTSSGGIIIEGEGGYQVKFAKCCNPLPGDAIIGFVTRGFGVSIHKLDCQNVSESRKNEENLARWVNAAWEKTEFNSSENYEAAVQIITEDGIGVIASISMALADMRVSISSINTQTLKNGTVAINISIGCRNTSHFESIVSRLRSLKAVISVSRGFSN